MRKSETLEDYLNRRVPDFFLELVSFTDNDEHVTMNYTRQLDDIVNVKEILKDIAKAELILSTEITFLTRGIHPIFYDEYCFDGVEYISEVLDSKKGIIFMVDDFERVSKLLESRGEEFSSDIHIDKELQTIKFYM